MTIMTMSLLSLINALSTLRNQFVNRHNYAAQFPLHDKPKYKNITKGAAENWKKTSARERDFFSTLAQIMRRYVEQNRKYSPHHIVVLVHIVCLTDNFI